MKALTPPLPGEEANWIAGSNLHCPKIKLNIQHSFELGKISQKKLPFLDIAQFGRGKGKFILTLKSETVAKIVTLAVLKERMFFLGSFPLHCKRK